MPKTGLILLLACRNNADALSFDKKREYVDVISASYGQNETCFRHGTYSTKIFVRIDPTHSLPCPRHLAHSPCTLVIIVTP